MTLFWVWAARLIVVVTVIAMLRHTAAAKPLLWINPTTGGGAARALGRKARLGIHRFEVGGALFVPWRGCASCPTLRHLRRRGRAHLILLPSVVWGRRVGNAGVRFGVGVVLSASTAPVVDLVLAIG